MLKFKIISEITSIGGKNIKEKQQILGQKTPPHTLKVFNIVFKNIQI